ncbi:MAG: hypothetical protein WC695_00800 [Candidatus Omnitrophota bacterium]
MIKMKPALKYTAIFLFIFFIGIRLYFFDPSPRIILVKPALHVFADAGKRLVVLVKPAYKLGITRAVLKNEAGQVIGPLTGERSGYIPRTTLFQGSLAYDSLPRHLYVEVCFEDGVVFKKEVAVERSRRLFVSAVGQVEQRGGLLEWPGGATALFYTVDFFNREGEIIYSSPYLCGPRFLVPEQVPSCVFRITAFSKYLGDRATSRMFEYHPRTYDAFGPDVHAVFLEAGKSVFLRLEAVTLRQLKKMSVKQGAFFSQPFTLDWDEREQNFSRTLLLESIPAVNIPDVRISWEASHGSGEMVVNIPVPPARAPLGHTLAYDGGESVMDRDWRMDEGEETALELYSAGKDFLLPDRPVLARIPSNRQGAFDLSAYDLFPQRMYVALLVNRSRTENGAALIRYNRPFYFIYQVKE